MVSTTKAVGTIQGGMQSRQRKTIAFLEWVNTMIGQQLTIQSK